MQRVGGRAGHTSGLPRCPQHSKQDILKVWSDGRQGASRVSVRLSLDWLLESKCWFVHGTLNFETHLQTTWDSINSHYSISHLVWRELLITHWSLATSLHIFVSNIFSRYERRFFFLFVISAAIYYEDEIIGILLKLRILCEQLHKTLWRLSHF